MALLFPGLGVDYAGQSPEQLKSDITAAQAKLAAETRAASGDLTSSTGYGGGLSAFTNPYSLVDAGGWLSPLKDSAGPGGYGFNSGLGGNSEEQLAFKTSPSNAGLWAAGYDPSDPNLNYKLQEYMNANKLSKSDLDGFYKNNPNGTFANAMDWYFHDLGGRMGKSNNFLDTGIGSVIGTIGQFALGAVPVVGPALSAGLGAYLGQRNGGVLGGLLGAAGGYGAGKFGAGVATNGLTSTIGSAANSIGNFIQHPIDSIGNAITSAGSSISGLLGGNSGFTNPSGLGLTPSSLYNPASLGGTVAASNGLGTAGLGLLTPNLASLGGSAGLNAALGSGTISNGLGLVPQDLYNPASLGETASSGTTSNGPSATDYLQTAGKLGQLLAPGEEEGGLMGAGAPQSWGNKFAPFVSPYGQIELLRPQPFQSRILG